MEHRLDSYLDQLDRDYQEDICRACREKNYLATPNKDELEVIFQKNYCKNCNFYARIAEV